VSTWNLLFLKSQTFTPDTSRSAEWNHCAYLVNGAAHCGACHTPKNIFGADRGGEEFRGGVLDNWTAQDLTSNTRTGLGGWTAADIAEYLRTGRNGHAGAGGPMAEVVTYSTSLLDDADRAAIATYLASVSASSEEAVSAADAAAVSHGAAVYSDACASCHLENGVGQPGLFPPLGRNAVLQQSDAAGLTHLILAGTRIATTPTQPSPLAMPAFLETDRSGSGRRGDLRAQQLGQPRSADSNERGDGIAQEIGSNDGTLHSQFGRPGVIGGTERSTVRE
jgi:mono/diheme cytochrome c family protein